jgi:hypothetical protein
LPAAARSAKGEIPTSAIATATDEFGFSQTTAHALRLTLPGDAKARNKALDANPKLKAAVAARSSCR